MKKINLIAKNIIISLISLILIISFSFRKELNTNIREDAINLRSLVTKDNLPLSILLLFCFWNLFFFLLFVYNLIKSGICCGSCEMEDEQPNKLTLLYFSLIISAIATTFICLFLGIDLPFSIFVYTYSGVFVIWSIIYLVRCCLYPEIYCTKVCEFEYLKELAKYPLDIYIPCLREDYNTEYGFGECICSILYIFVTAIPYYAFLPIFILFWLIIKMFISCNCCNCCKYCSKKKKIASTISNKQNIPNNAIIRKDHFIPIDNNEQIHITRAKYEFYGFMHFEQNAPENNNNNAIEYNIYVDDNNNNY